MGDSEGHLRFLLCLTRMIEEQENKDYIKSRTLMMIEAYKRNANEKSKQSYLMHC